MHSSCLRQSKDSYQRNFSVNSAKNERHRRTVHGTKEPSMLTAKQQSTLSLSMAQSSQRHRDFSLQELQGYRHLMFPITDMYRRQDREVKQTLEKCSVCACLAFYSNHLTTFSVDIHF